MSGQHTKPSVDEAFVGLDGIDIANGLLRHCVLYGAAGEPLMELTPVGDCPAFGKGEGPAELPKGFEAPYVRGANRSTCKITLLGRRDKVSFSVWPAVTPKATPSEALAPTEWPDSVRNALRDAGNVASVFFTDDGDHILGSYQPGRPGEVVEHAEADARIRRIYINSCGFDGFNLGSLPSK
jgi:hypothetical protein